MAVGLEVNDDGLDNLVVGYVQWPAQGINHEVLDDAAQDVVAMTFQNGALDVAHGIHPCAVRQDAV